MCPDGRDEHDWAERPSRRGPGPVPENFGGISLYGPVSVMPPTSWRRAAWFIVAATSIVLVVLVFAAVRLAGPDGRIGQIDAFPGPPTGGLLTPRPPSTGELSAPGKPDRQADLGQPATSPPPGGGTQTLHEEPNGGRPDARPPGQDGDGQTGGPPSSGEPTSQGPAGGTDDVKATTEKFFDLLPEDIDAAWQMLSPQGQQPGFAKFNQQWRRYRDVELQHLTVGTDGSTVVATVLVTEPKGTSSTQRWKLTYTHGDSLVIDEFTLLADGPNEPQDA